MGYVLYLLSLLLIYVVLSASLNLIFGWTGLLAVTHAAFMGVGAYATGLLTLRLGWGFLPAVTAGAGLAALLGWLLTRLTVRLREEYYVIASFGFQVIAYNIFNNWISLTGGPMGLSGVPMPLLLGWRLPNRGGLLLFVAAVSLLLLWVAYAAGHSPYGRLLRAIREDDGLARTLGKDVPRVTASVFALAAAQAAIAGGLFAALLSYLHPSSLSIHESIFMLSMVIVGGSGSFWGGVVGAVVLTLLPEALSFITALGDVAPQLRQIAYALMIILFLLWRPEGLLRERTGQVNRPV